MNNFFKNELYNNILNDFESIDINKQCLICKEEIEYDFIKLSCNHIFHYKCLNNSFIKKR